MFVVGWTAGVGPGEVDDDGDVAEMVATGEAPDAADVQEAANKASTTRPTMRILGRGSPLGGSKTTSLGFQTTLSSLCPPFAERSLRLA
jgi:hypothetical protein